ncbi:MAG: molybdate ABC transporter substrate-binding protein [Pirellulaceae bacterium]
MQIIITRLAVIALVNLWLAGGLFRQTIQPALFAEEPGVRGASPTGGKALASAAASTKDVMESLAEQFAKKSKHTIKINPGSSNSLAGQIVAGAPADLFLSANEEWAEKVKEAKISSEQVKLLTNKLVLIVPKGNPAGLKVPKDLNKAAVKRIALAGEKVPAGKYADQALTKLGLLDGLTKAKKIAHGQDVRTALAYVERGEAEAGIVYSTDFLAAKNVEMVHEFDPALHDEIVYILVLLKHGKDNSAAKGFFEFLKSDEANETYKKFGFERLSGTPEDTEKK